MAVLALLALTSQSLAVVKLPCDHRDHRDQSSSSAMHTMVMDSDHASHGQLRSDKKVGGDDFCSQERCSQMDCISAGVALLSTQVPYSYQFPQTLDTEYSASFHTLRASSLFRPPISR